MAAKGDFNYVSGLIHEVASSPGPFPAFQRATLKSWLHAEKLGMGLGTRLSMKNLSRLAGGGGEVMEM